MADLVKGAEAELFGAYEWAREHYEGLRELPEPADRRAVEEALMRVTEALEDYDASAEAADGLVAAEEDVPDALLTRLRPVAEARDALLKETDTDAQAKRAGPFLDAFEAAWAEGPDGLALDAAFAALVQGNLLAMQGAKAPGWGDEALEARAAQGFERLGRVLQARVKAGETMWQESARQCFHRATVLWRAAGNETRAGEASETARSFGGGQGTYF